MHLAARKHDLSLLRETRDVRIRWVDDDAWMRDGFRVFFDRQG